MGKFASSQKIVAAKNNEASQFCKIDLIIHDVANSLIEKKHLNKLDLYIRRNSHNTKQTE